MVCVIPRTINIGEVKSRGAGGGVGGGGVAGVCVGGGRRGLGCGGDRDDLRDLVHEVLRLGQRERGDRVEDNAPEPRRDGAP